MAWKEQLKKLGDIDVKKSVDKSMEFIRAAAVNLVPVNHGELKQSIFTDSEIKGNKVTGVCYTNKEYAIFVEFGTGPKGEAHHAGISPKVSPVYAQSGWWVHEDMVPAGTAEKYHWKPLHTSDGIFYRVNGQAAQPFMYPAMHDNREAIIKLMCDELKTEIRKI